MWPDKTGFPGGSVQLKFPHLCGHNMVLLTEDDLSSEWSDKTGLTVTTCKTDQSLMISEGSLSAKKQIKDFMFVNPAKDS